MRLITSRRSEFVGTPPTVRLRPLSTVSPVAGPTIEIAADPFPLSTLKLTSLPVDELRLQPAGAACPEGSIATADSVAGFAFAATTGFAGRLRDLCRRASRNCLRRIDRRRACRAR